MGEARSENPLPPLGPGASARVRIHEDDTIGLFRGSVFRTYHRGSLVPGDGSDGSNQVRWTMRATRGHTLALKDRADAGRQLAERLLHLQPERPVILALPRGGVPVGFEIARRLDAPLDVLLVRKVGDPRNPEYGLGAIVEDDGLLLDEDRVRATGITRVDLEPVIRREREEITRRARIYRANRPRIDWKERTVIVVDDGAATGGTLLAALRMAREQGARRIVVALGVAPADTCQRLKREVDELVVLLEPESFYAVGQFYEQFEPVEDDEVVELLRRATGR